MVYSITWDETKPDDNNYGYEIDNYIRNVLIAVRERLAAEHTDITGSGGLAVLMHKWAVTAKSTGSPYTALVTDHLLLITTGASDYTINLYTAVGNTGKILKIKKVDSGVGTVIIDGATTETIDGDLTLTLFEQYDFVDLVSDGVGWIIISGMDQRTMVMPVGTILATGRTAAPNGYLLCNGAEISRTTYAVLFAAISTAFGVGNGSTTFNLPDLRGRVPVGKDVATFVTLGGTGGEETDVLIANEIPAHTHSVLYTTGEGSAPSLQQVGLNATTTGSAGGDAAHNNIQPYQVVNYIIKY